MSEEIKLPFIPKDDKKQIRDNGRMERFCDGCSGALYSFSVPGLGWLCGPCLDKFPETERKAIERAIRMNGECIERFRFLLTMRTSAFDACERAAREFDSDAIQSLKKQELEELQEKVRSCLRLMADYEKRQIRLGDMLKGNVEVATTPKFVLPSKEV